MTMRKTSTLFILLCLGAELYGASAAPDPASPTTCSEPMFDAKIDAPMIHQLRLRPARK